MSDILGLIDGPLDDWQGSADSMRWRAGGDVHEPLHEPPGFSGDPESFTAAMDRLGRALGIAGEQLEDLGVRLQWTGIASGADPAEVAAALAHVASAHLGTGAKLAAAHRRAWSGPNKLERQIARAYRIPVRALMPTPLSALDAGYQQRQRNRRKRA
ncbi:hypothetical protein ABIA32_003076 [Streptacidiphilus sp. MAP12-20]|uniref:hypothetical protein n=1 Tax=Streptacidiphilus sp. MAP12-20 TaxID=3156299 RepID=UPI0035117B18